MSSIGKKQFESSVESMQEAIRRVHECDAPDIIFSLGVVMHQCDALKAAALAYASEIEMGRHLSSKKKP